MITIERLKEVLEYNSETGLFKYKIINSNAVRNKKFAGGIDEKGYIRIKIDNKKYRAHRLAWFYMTGVWPIEIDHKDLNKQNNKWENLREATRSQNCLNTNVKITNKLGIKGVVKSGNKFQSEIMINGKRIYLGKFDTIEEAKNAYNKACINLHKDFARF